MNEINNKVINDKRQFFRVDDIAFISYKVISWAEARSSQGSSNLPVQKLTFKKNLDRLSRELQPLHKVIKASSPNVAEYLTILDRKINLLSEYLLDDDGISYEVDPQQINIGGGGLQFHTDKPLMVGAMLELNLRLLPEDIDLCSYARVVCCDSIAADKRQTGYRVGVEFVFMDDDVRDLITRHVLEKERELISKR